MHISQFKIKNFKSFRETDEVGLATGINLVAGKNNVGKTALLEALDPSGPSTGHRSIKTRASVRAFDVEGPEISLKLCVQRDELLDLLAGTTVWLPAPVILNAPNPRVLHLRDYSHESLNAFREWIFSQDSFTFDLVADRAAMCYKPARVPSFGLYDAIETDSPSYFRCSIGQDRTTKLLSEHGLKRIGRSDEMGGMVGKKAKEFFYRFSSERLASGSATFGGSRVLASNAENLAEVLGTLSANRKQFDRLAEGIREIFPQVHMVSVKPEGDKQTVLLWGKAAYENEREDLAYRLSESGTGVGQVLAILYVILTSVSPRIIAIDEPQSFLHPGAARKLIEILKLYPIHQYLISTHSPTIITAATPKRILLVQHDGNESSIEFLSADDAFHLRRYLDDIGASLADVFGADNIIWVEGVTEEKCYPLIVERILGRPLLGTVFKAVVNTGDFEGKHAERFVTMYERLSSARSLLPPAIAFVFDDETRTETEKTKLRSMCKRTFFTRFRMYENYLLNAKAITAVLNGQEILPQPCTEQEVQDCLDECLQDQKYFRHLPKESTQDYRSIKADWVLDEVFTRLAKCSYRKPVHAIDLTNWIIENAPNDFADIPQMLNEALDPRKA